MRNLILLAVLAVLALPAAEARSVTVEQLRQLLVSPHAAKQSDAELARLIVSLDLTEQLTAPMLERIESKLKPGPKTAGAMDLLADSSTFLDPPAGELPAKAPPDARLQRTLLSAAVTYVAGTLLHLPNFLATRITRSFDDKPFVVSRTGWSPSNADLHLAGISSREIAYRDGHEVFSDAPLTKARLEDESSPIGLASTGEFGPVLATILIDTVAGKVTWSHWEQTSTGLAAVFHYMVPRDASDYHVTFCCIAQAQSPDPFNPTQDPSRNSTFFYGKPAYHGSLYLDPATGAILRVTLQAELKNSDPVTRTDISVQYGSVQIGGKTYICPVRSVAISSDRVRLPRDPDNRTILHINEVTFTNYHRFGSTSRVISELPVQ